MVTTKMNWSGPNCDFLPKWITIWTWPIHFGCDQIIMVKSKSIWSDQNCFGHIEGQGIRPLNLWNFNYFNKTILRLLTVLICYLKVKTNLCENYISIVNKKRYFGTKFVFPASVYGGNRLNRYGAALGLMNHDIPTLKTV